MTAPLFTAADYQALHAIVFATDSAGRHTYPGYRPEVVESPNGDGARDTTKRYAHVAVKYLDRYRDGWNRGMLVHYLRIAHKFACEVACALGVPDAFMPDFTAGALRVLEYPPGAGSHVHTDVGLLTLNLYRDQPAKLITHGPHGSQVSGVQECHLGRIAREIGVGPAAPHSVDPSEFTQHSIVYFAVPDHAAMLPGDRRLGDWLDREMAKMRYDR